MGGEPSAQARALATQVERDGGTTLAIYQEPVGDHWQIFCLLPRERVEASPYQRDLSPTHVKRLTETIKRLDRFVDPIVVISPKPGVYWRSEEHTSELQSLRHLVCRLLLEKKKQIK